MPAKKPAPNPRAARVGEPFHKALFRLRYGAYHSEVQLAGEAGCTVAEYRSVESGKLPCSRAIYDAAVVRYPQLKAHPRPGVDPELFTPPVHAAVAYERTRLSDLMDLFRQLNVGRTNKQIIRKLLTLSSQGIITIDDIELFFGSA